VQKNHGIGIVLSKFHCGHSGYLLFGIFFRPLYSSESFCFRSVMYKREVQAMMIKVMVLSDIGILLTYSHKCAKPPLTQVNGGKIVWFPYVPVLLT